MDRIRCFNPDQDHYERQLCWVGTVGGKISDQLSDTEYSNLDRVSYLEMLGAIWRLCRSSMTFFAL